MPETNQTIGAELIAAERQRQITEEGYTPEGDAGRYAELSVAADCYRHYGHNPAPQQWWPWAEAYWKPSTPLRNLVRAGALYLAAADAGGHPAGIVSAANDCATEINRRLVKMHVEEIGEDTGTWFVENALHDDEARVVIEHHIDISQYDDELAEEMRAALFRATFDVRRLWFATGHSEGAVVTDEEPPQWVSGLWVEGQL